MQDKTKQEYTSTNHIVKYIGLFGSVEILKNLANLSRGKITAFFLGPAGVGLLAIYYNILDVIRSCTNMGLETASIQQLSEVDTETQPEEAAVVAKVIRTWSMAVAILGVVICLVAAMFLNMAFFSEGGHHTEIMLLAPAAFLVPVTAGECAILKGLHKLKRVATVELLGTVGTVIVSLAVYGTLGLTGIILALNLCFAVETAAHLYFCTRIMPYRIDLLSKNVWTRGIPLLRFGIPYAATSLMGAVTVTVVYNVISTTSEVGFYKTAHALLMYYIGMILSSNATDYFPRLTSASHDRELKNDIVNKQIQVSQTITTPLVMAFLLGIPIIIPVLYTMEFMPMADICIMAGIFLLLHSVSQPLEYVALAHGHSWLYLILEGLYDAMLIAAVYFLYRSHGLLGIGVGLSAVGVANLAILSVVTGMVYKIRMTPKNWIAIIINSILVLSVISLCYMGYSILTVCIGGVITAAVAVRSYLTLRTDMRNGK